MTRNEFIRLVEKVLDSLPSHVEEKIENLAFVVEDTPPGQLVPEPGADDRLLMGVFEGVPLTQRSTWEAPGVLGPDRIVLYQKNIEAVCETESEIRREVRLTLLHELGHYFGMTEDQLDDV